MASKIPSRPSKAALSLLVGLTLMAGPATTLLPTAAAQTRADTLSLVVPPVMTVAPSSETPLDIQIAPQDAAPRRAMVLIRGLPGSIALSEGRLFESGVWSIPAADLGRLKLTAPSGSQGRSELSISVVTLDGTVLAEANAALEIAAPAPSPAPVPRVSRADPSENSVFTAAPTQAARSQQPAEPAAARPSLVPQLTPEAKNRLLALVRKGDDALRTGNIVNARLLYQHAAEKGLAEAALALAATYDEAELSRLRVRGGISPNPEQARRWYEKARELGSPQAQERLQQLGFR